MTEIDWINKYRLCNMSSINGPKKMREQLHQFLKCKSLPSFLVHGPPGTGKTQIMLSFFSKYYGKHVNERCIYLGTEIGRGISMVRDVISRHLSESILEIEGLPTSKFIILDNADMLSTIFQCPLKKIMEKRDRKVGFCIICNDISSIIHPVISRCFKIRIHRYADIFVEDHLTRIAKLENINGRETDIKKIVEYSRGNMQMAILCLQKCKICNFENIDEFDIHTGPVIDNSENILTLCEKLCAYNTKKILNTLMKNILNDRMISQKNKYELIMNLSKLENKLKNGICVAHYINFISCLRNICGSKNL